MLIFFYFSGIFRKMCFFGGMSIEISMLVCWINLLKLRECFLQFCDFHVLWTIIMSSLCILALKSGWWNFVWGNVCVHMEAQFTGLKTFIIYNWTYYRIIVRDLYCYIWSYLCEVSQVQWWWIEDIWKSLDPNGSTTFLVGRRKHNERGITLEMLSQSLIK